MSLAHRFTTVAARRSLWRTTSRPFHIQRGAFAAKPPASPPKKEAAEEDAFLPNAARMATVTGAKPSILGQHFGQPPEPPSSSTAEQEGPASKSTPTSAFAIYASLAAFCFGGVVGFFVLPRADDDKYRDLSFWARCKRRGQSRWQDLYNIFAASAFDQLLPDPHPPPYHRPYTLVIELDKLLTCSKWNVSLPSFPLVYMNIKGENYFLSYLCQFYEIVVFTHLPSYQAEGIISRLDPYQYITYRLAREGTRFVNGHIVKDLSLLNRDLSKVIMLDHDASHAELQPDNLIQIKPWQAEESDDAGELLRLVPFLEAVAGPMQIKDVRPILHNYKGKDIPSEFAEFQRRLHREKSPASNFLSQLKRIFVQQPVTDSAVIVPNGLPVEDAEIMRERQLRHEMFVREAAVQAQLVEAEKKKHEESIKRMMDSVKDQRVTLWEVMIHGPPMPEEMKQQRDALLAAQST